MDNTLCPARSTALSNCGHQTDWWQRESSDSSFEPVAGSADRDSVISQGIGHNTHHLRLKQLYRVTDARRAS